MFASERSIVGGAPFPFICHLLAGALGLLTGGCHGGPAPSSPPEVVSQPLSFSACPARDGLVAWWSAEGSGDDLTGSYPGHLQAGGRYVPGKIGQAFSFDGQDGGFVVSPEITLDQFTIQLWFRPDQDISASAPGVQSLADKTAAGAIVSASGAIEVVGPTPRPRSTTTSWTAHTWYHLAVTFDGASYKMYVNGRKEDDQASALSILHLDSNQGGAFTLGRNFSGAIDEAAVYRRALGADEVVALYASGGQLCDAGCDGVPGGRVSHWSAEGSLGDTEGGRNIYYRRNSLDAFTPFVTGKQGTGFHLDGNSEVLVVYQPFALPRFTFQTWWKPDEDLGPGNPKDRFLAYASTSAGHLSFMAGDPVLQLRVANKRIQGTTSHWLAGHWYHIATTFDGSTYRIYVNGVQEASGAATQSMLGGSDGLSMGLNVAGTMDEMSVYNRGLSATEIRAIYGAAGKSCTAACDYIAPNKISVWRGEGDGSDGVGNRTAQLVGGVTYGPGWRGQGFRLDGSPGSKLVIPPQVIAGHFSMEIWMKPDRDLLATDNASHSLFQQGSFAGSIAGGSGVASFGNAMSATRNWVAGQWYHLVLTFDGDHYRFFVNGAVEGESASTTSYLSASSPLEIGDQLPATLDEIAIYDRGLTATEVVTLFGQKDSCLCAGAADPATACSDSNRCVTSSCGADGWCHKSYLSDGNACDDGDRCNGADSCQSGRCVRAAPLICQAPDATTNVSCNPTLGCQYSKAIYTVEDLGTIGTGDSVATAINQVGTIVGSTYPNGCLQPLQKRAGAPTEFLRNPPGFCGQANAIANSGAMAFYEVPATDTAHGEVWRQMPGGTIERVGIPPGHDWATPRAISDTGDILVTAYRTVGGTSVTDSYWYRSGSGFEAIASPFSGSSLVAFTLDRFGRVFGRATRDPAGNPVNPTTAIMGVRAASGAWKVEDLNGRIPPNSGWDLQNATATNGRIVAGTGYHGGLNSIWTLDLESGDFHELPIVTRSGELPSVNAVSVGGDVIGAVSFQGVSRAYSYNTTSGTHWLDAVVPEGSSLTPAVVRGVTSWRELVGSGTTRDGQTHALRLVPTISCLPASCDDGNAGTDDFCDDQGQCQHAVTPTLGPCVGQTDGTSCSDGNACNGTETCQSELCTAGVPLSCDDGNACTADTCDPVNGCSSVVDQAMNGLACGGTAGCPSICSQDTCSADPRNPDGCFVTPVVSCVIPHRSGDPNSPDGSFQVVFGYRNLKSSNVYLPKASGTNFLSGGESDSQPTWFRGATKDPNHADSTLVPAAFTVQSNGADVSWTIAGNTATAHVTDDTSQRCQIDPNGPEGDLVTIDNNSYTPTYSPAKIAARAVVPAPAASLSGTPTGRIAAGISGKFSVANDGSAHYTIPLNVPAGRAGMQPAIALTFASENGNGPLGVAWSLQGALSQIRPCSRSLDTDGVAGPIQFNKGDALCLDGQRLVKLSAPVVPEAGDATVGEFRTENDSGARILAHYNPKGTVAWFQVIGRDGHKMTYGGENAPVDAAHGWEWPAGVQTNPEPFRVSWPLVQTEDQYQNAITYSYLSAATPTHPGFILLPDTIQYTSSPAHPRAERSVKFIYEERPDVDFLHGAEVPTRVDVRLKRIELYTPMEESATRYYFLQYKQSVATNRSLLTSVSECEPGINKVVEESDSGDDVCKQPLTLRWKERQTDFTPKDTGIDVMGAHGDMLHATVYPVDFNGDGRDDIAYVEDDNHMVANVGEKWSALKGTLHFYSSNAAAYAKNHTQPVYTESTSFDLTGYQEKRLKYALPRFVDLNGDGRPEMLITQDADKQGYFFAKTFYAFNGSSFQPFTNIPPPLSPRMGCSVGCVDYSVGILDSQVATADVDGDGRPEVYDCTDSGNLRTPEEIAMGDIYAWQVFQYGPTGIMSPLGVNLSYSRWGSYVVPYHPYGSNHDVLRDGANDSVFTADLDGDGRDESIEVDGTTGELMIDGDSASKLSLGASHLKNLRVLDYDGDGNLDILVVSDNFRGTSPPTPSSTLRWFKWTSAGFVERRTSFNPGRPTYGPEGSWRMQRCSYRKAADSPPFCNKTVCDFPATREDPDSGDPIEGQCELLDAVEARHPADWTTAYKTSQVLDWNGDGLADFVEVDKSTNHLMLYIQDGPGPADQMYNISEGLGEVTTFTLKPMTDPDVYTPGTDCTFPLKCLTKGRNLVSDVDVNSSGVWMHNSYTYEDARMDIAGRGFLGFAKRVMTHDRLTPGPYKLVDQTETRFDRAFESISTGDSGAPGSQTRAYPFVGLPTRETTIISGLKNNPTYQYRMASEVISEYALVTGVAGAPGDRSNSAIWRVINADITEKQYENDPDRIHPRLTANAHYEHDSYGNMELSRKTIRWRVSANADEETSIDEKDLTFSDPDDGAFSPLRFLGLPQTRSVKSEYGGMSQTLETAYEYDDDHAIRKQVTRPKDVAPNPAVPPVGAFFERNSEGMVVRTSQANPDVASPDDDPDERSTKVSYDAREGMYPELITNAAGHVTRQIYASEVDAVVWTQSPNGIVSRNTYDPFGRLITVTGAEQTGVVMNYTSAGGYPLVVTKQNNDGSGSRESFDEVGHSVVVEKRTPTGTWATLATRSFDSDGRVASVQGPYGVVHFEYDEIGRVVTQWRTPTSAPDADQYSDQVLAKGTVAYDYLTRVSTDEVGRVSRVIKDGLGRDRSRSDQRSADPTDSLPTQFTYGPFGQIRQVTVGAPGSERLTSIEYDALGRRSSLTTPDTRPATTEYDRFGSPIREVDGSGRRQEYLRDQLGRVSKRTESAVGSQQPEITTYEYDRAPYGIGQLASSLGSTGVRNVYAYDQNFGSVRETDRYIENGVAPYAIEQKTDELGRLKELTYPAVPEIDLPRFGVRYDYDSVGMIASVSDAVTSNQYWQATNREVFGRLAGEVFGNGVVSTREYFPDGGRLKSITTADPRDASTIQALSYTYLKDGDLATRTDLHDPTNPLREGFGYDFLDRLDRWFETSESGAEKEGDHWSVKYGYDDQGNLTGRTSHSPGISDQAVVNRYDETGGAGAHGITSSSLWAGQFMYDGAGNMTKHPMSGVLQYNGFGLPTSVSGASWQLGFTYDADGVRVTKTVGETPDETTVYVGGLYERRQPGGGDRTRAAHVFYVGAGGKTVAQVVRTNENLADPVSRQRLTYAYVDQQGSTEVTRTEPGATSEPAHEVRNHYDPFGNLLAASSAGFDPRVVPGGIDMTGRDDVTSGFTGHEADGEIGLVNMGGRIYDPRIGRFLSPDPFVQDALFSQSHNRYTYVVNNPLKFTDPSGYNRCGSQGHDVPDSQCDERVTEDTARDGLLGGTYTWCGNDGDGGDGYVPCAKLSPAEQFAQYNGENDFLSVQEMNTQRANQRADDLPVLDELRELYAIADTNAANAERDEMRAQQKRAEEERIAALNTGGNPTLSMDPMVVASGYGDPAGRISVSERVDPGVQNLVGVNAYGNVPGHGERIFYLTPDALNAFRGLMAAAANSGFGEELFTLTSAYRSQERQDSLAAGARAEYGADAGKWVAQGRSEHITGRAFDLNLGPKNSSENARAGAFDNLAAFRWLQQNAKSFGLNSYDAEPWHWSYNVR